MLKKVPISGTRNPPAKEQVITEMRDSLSTVEEKLTGRDMF